MLSEAAAALGLELPAAFAEQIGTYLDELERWERIGALTAYRDRAARVRHLVVESLMLLAALPDPAAPLLDIGSGAGVPGLVLKLARPDWPVALIEAGWPDEGLKYCQRAIELKAEYADAHRNLGIALADLGRFDEAIASYDRAIQHDPAQTDAVLTNRARVHLIRGNYDAGWRDAADYYGRGYRPDYWSYDPQGGWYFGLHISG